jgi:hypothetical protein
MLLAGDCDPNDLRKEAGADRFGRIELARFDLQLFGIEEHVAAGIQRLGRFCRAIEEIRRGTNGLERIAGEKNVPRTGG